MSETLLVPMASGPGTIRIWLGCIGLGRLPEVKGWQVSGKAVPAAAIRVVRPLELVRLPTDPEDRPAATGVWEIDCAGAARLDVMVDGRWEGMELSPLPAAFPGSGEPLRILLCSCFDYLTNAVDLDDLAWRELTGPNRPHLTLWMGDQVYLDQPLSKVFREDAAWLRRHFEEVYQRNWFGPRSLRSMLQLAPNVFTPDDHEYWNNFPLPTVIAPSTSNAPMRALWSDAAKHLFSAFQLGAGLETPAVLGQPVEVTIEPLSLLLLDSRSLRSPESGTLMDSSASVALKAWSERVASSSAIRCAGLVTGQSLLAKRQGWIKRNLADAEFPDFSAGYQELLDAHDRIVAAGKPVVLLTGDVHFGRISSLLSPTRGSTGWEIISSPISKVSDPFDTPKTAFNELPWKRERWPLHSSPPEAPAQFPTQETLSELGHRPTYSTRFQRGQRGNHVALLSLERTGSGLRGSVRYIPIASANDPSPAEHFDHLNLRPVLNG